MRIGIVTGEYPPMQGGISTQTRLLAEKLTQAGEGVFVFTDERANEQVPGVQLIAETTRWGVHTLWRLRRWTQTHSLDVINLHYQTAAYGMSPFVHFLPEVLPVPVVTTFHDLRFPYLFPKAGPLRDWIVMRLARASAGVVATNQEDAARLAMLPRRTLIPIGSNVMVDAASEADARAFVDAGPDDMVLAFFGFVNRSKGLEDLLAAAAELRARGIPAHLLMVGEKLGASDPTNAAYAQQIQAQIVETGLGDCVHWTGHASEADVRAYLRSADAVVMPFVDGASYRRSSLIVALHHGAAVVTTQPQVKVPSFRHGENLWLVPPANSPDLTEALQHLYNNPSLNRRLRRGALELSQEFRWERIVTNYSAFYRQVLEDCF